MLQRLQYLHQQYPYAVAFIPLAVIYICNLFIDVMEIDAAQYASIAREMMESGSYLEVYHHGKDYLDKPPLLFWLSSLSFSIFGISNWAYKLPATLCLVLGIYSTFRFAKLWYNHTTGVIAALMLGYTQAFFLITNDVRTDGLLTGFAIYSAWQISAYLKEKHWKHIVGMAVGVGGAMLAKGPIGLIIPAMAFSADFVMKRQWKNFLKWEWLAAGVLLAIILLPMSYGLYTQYDLHPEKVAYGLQGPSGVEFYFWTQSFGRITGDIYWDNGAPFHFFLGSIMWDFQPWILLLFPALFVRIKRLFLNKLRVSENNEYITFFGFVLLFLALSTSRYKLPHYIFPLFPFATVMCADFLLNIHEKGKKLLFKIQFGIMHLFFVMVALYFVFVSPPDNFFLPLLALSSMGLFYWTYSQKKSWKKLVWPTLIAVFTVNFISATDFYPRLLKYQSSSVVGKALKEKNLNTADVVSYIKHGHAMDFYSETLCHKWEVQDSLLALRNVNVGTWVFTHEEGKNEILTTYPELYTVNDEFTDYKITVLTPKFLNRNTREEKLKKTYLLEKVR